MNKIIRFIVIVFGIGLASYPWISNYLYERSAGSEIITYQKSAEKLSDDKYVQILNDAIRYNENLAKSHVVLTDPFQQETDSTGTIADYHTVLKIDDSGVIANIEIPSIRVKLPIYKGTSGAVLEKGVGHLEGTSLPVGGVDTHSVLTGHTGLSSAKLFTDLTELKEGDYFFIHVLGKILAYKIDKILIVEPTDTKDLTIINGQDYITLVTCTPYGVNSHRLLVRGVRTTYNENTYQKEKEKQHTNSEWMKAWQKALLIGLIIGMALYILQKIRRKHSRRSLIS